MSLGVSALPDSTPPATTFSYLRPVVGNFALVLDRSGSMDSYGRMDRLKQAAVKWIQLKIQDGSYLGIVSFSSDVTTDANMTEITGKITCTTETYRKQTNSHMSSTQYIWVCLDVMGL